jgi:6-phosphogluconate dehydrogenase
MRFGIIGLGKMGFNLALNAKNHKHKVIAYNRSKEKVDKIKKYKIDTAYSIEELMKKLGKNKVIWLMVTAGKATDATLKSIIPYLRKGDIVIDGGNSFYKDSIKHATLLNKKGIKFLDVGTSGGISGARNGANFMIGGDLTAYNKTEKLFNDLSVKKGYGYFGKPGAGHFVKMVHNGIEYGMMQAIGEGMEVIEKSKFNPDKEKLCDVWANGSVIRSWLIELARDAYKSSKALKGYNGVVGLSGEGEWTIKTAKELKVPVQVIEDSVKARIKSKKSKRYQGKVVQSLRFGFGGHKQPK